MNSVAPLLTMAGGTVILIAAAVIPAVFLTVYIYRKDRLEKEPTGLIKRLIVMGIISTFIAIMLERVGTAILNFIFPRETLLYDLLLYFVVVGFSEEISKFTVLEKVTWNSPYFDCKFDGIVYAVTVSLGFALWENINYVLSYGFSTAVVRAFTAVPGHACFGVFMGFWYSMAKQNELKGDAATAKKCRRLCVVMPMVIHGLYDFIACLTTSAGVFIGYVLIMFGLSFFIVKRISNTDRYLTD